MIAASLGVAGAQTVLAARDAAAPDDVGAPAALVYLIAGEPGPSEQARLTRLHEQGLNLLLVRTGEAGLPASLAAVPQVDLRSWRDLGQYRTAVLQLLAVLGLRPSYSPGPQAEWWIRHRDALTGERKRVTELYYLTDAAIANSHWFDRHEPFRWAEKAIDEDHLTFVHQLRDLAPAETGSDPRFGLLRESCSQIPSGPHEPAGRLPLRGRPGSVR